VPVAAGSENFDIVVIFKDIHCVGLILKMTLPKFN
jgi:hypothetical protein